MWLNIVGSDHPHGDRDSEMDQVRCSIQLTLDPASRLLRRDPTRPALALQDVGSSGAASDRDGIMSDDDDYSSGRQVFSDDDAV